MRSVLGSIASLTLMTLVIGCSTVDADECWPNTSGGISGGGTIPIGAGVGASTSGDFISPPPGGPLDYGGAPNPCVTPQSLPMSPPKSPYAPTPDEVAAIEAAHNTDPQQLARMDAKAGFAAYALAGMTDTQLGDPNAVDVATLQGVITQEASAAWDAAKQWIVSVDPTTLSSPGYPIKVECLDPPASCKPSVTCDFAKICVLNDCGDGKCRPCPATFGLGNLAISGWCTYLCYDVSQNNVGIALNFRPRVGSNIVPWIKVCLQNN